MSRTLKVPILRLGLLIPGLWLQWPGSSDHWCQVEKSRIVTIIFRGCSREIGSDMVKTVEIRPVPTVDLQANVYQ